MTKGKKKSTFIFQLYIFQLCILLFTLGTIYSSEGPTSYAIIGIELVFTGSLFILNLNKIVMTDLITILISMAFIIFGYLYHNNSIIYCGILSILFMIVKSEKIIIIYGIAQMITFLYFSIQAFIGIRPLFGFQSIVFGFQQKNVAGYFLLSIMIAIFKILDRYKLRYSLLVLLLSLYVESFLINDRTAALLILIFFIIYKQNLIPKSRISKILAVSLPVLLTIISLYLLNNYGKVDFLYKIDEILSKRVQIWQLFWSYFSPKLSPQDVSLLVSRNLTNLPFDGVYASGLLQYGYIFYLLIILLLSNSIYFSIKENNKYLYTTIIIYILLGFTESVAFNSIICYLLPFSISAFSCQLHIKMNHRKEIKEDESFNNSFCV